MKQMILLLFVSFTCIATIAQTNNQKNYDSLKKDIKALGNLFRKAGTVTVKVDSIEPVNKDLQLLKQNLQQVTGVKKVEEQHQSSTANFLLSYKGKASDLWLFLPPNTQQLFTVKTSNDTAVSLHYRYAAIKPAAPTPVVNKTVQANTNVVATPEVKPAPAALSPEAVLLFKNVKTKLTDAEKNVFADGFVLSPDKKQFIMDKESGDFPYDIQLYPTDINKDGQEEIFMLWGNSFTSGMTGSSISLFIKDKTGKFVSGLGFPGTLPDVLSTSNLGYPDLLIGGPGFEFPVWRWNGKAYDFYKQVKEADYMKMKKTSVEDLSKAYMGGGL